MNLKRWLFLFFSTLAIGAGSSMLLGLFLGGHLWGQGAANAVYGLIGQIGLGMLFSLVTQMGFFAYLALHNFGLGLFRKLWSGVQVILIMFVFFDLVYIRYTLFGEGGSLFPFLAFPAGILLFAVVITLVKVNQTNSKAAIPTMFLMFVVSIIEWMPALHENQVVPMLYMLIPILCCNAWQVLQLHRLTKKNLAGGKSLT